MFLRAGGEQRQSSMPHRYCLPPPGPSLLHSHHKGAVFFFFFLGCFLFLFFFFLLKWFVEAQIVPVGGFWCHTRADLWDLTGELKKQHAGAAQQEGPPGPGPAAASVHVRRLLQLFSSTLSALDALSQLQQILLGRTDLLAWFSVFVLLKSDGGFSSVLPRGAGNGHVTCMSTKGELIVCRDQSVAMETPMSGMFVIPVRPLSLKPA